MYGKQLDIFSFIQVEEPAEEPPILLTKGQVVYLVNKADIIKYTVSDEEYWTWLCGENKDNRGYRLVEDTGCYSCTWNDKIIGKESFTDYENARNKADEYLKSHSGIILAKDIKPISIEAYSYIRKCDSRKMISFCCDLGNDTYYIKEFYTYHHIITGKKGKRALKAFKNQPDMKWAEECKDFELNLKNMYKCSSESDWDYAESGYTYSIG